VRRLRFLHIASSIVLASACGGATPIKERASRPVPRQAEPELLATETLDPVRTVGGLRGNGDRVRRCFEDAVGGFVRLAWRVAADGAVREPRVVRSTIGSKPVEECLKSVIAELHFGRPDRTSQAEWTFVHGLERSASAAPKKKEKRKKKRQRRRPADERTQELEEGIRIESSSSGWLEPGQIEGVVSDGFKLYAHCYREGLERQPSLGGAVRLRFVIDQNGQVAHVRDGGSDLPDQRVVDCVAEGFFALRFPKPSRGSVRVVYPIVFDSG
jgi:hypothetical protein